MRPPRLPALLLLLALPAAAEVHEPLSISAPRSSSPMPAATHRVPVTAVILQGSGWSWELVSRRLERVKEILAPCGVRVDPTIVELKSPSGSPSVLYELGQTQDPASLRVVTQVLAQPKPSIFYMKEFSDNTGQGGTSRTRHTTPGQPEEDTAWIPFSSAQHSYLASYLVDAHELVHALADIGHWAPPYQAPAGHRKGDPDPNAPDPGLMVGNPAVRTNHLDPYLCQRIKAHPRVSAL